MSEGSDLLVRISEGVAHCTFNKPEVLNAADPAVLAGLVEFADRVCLDPSVRAVVLTGNGRAFCAGGNVKKMGTGEITGSSDPGVQLRNKATLDDLFHKWIDLRQPVIAAVNGDAVGFGSCIALFCDIVYMAESARIGDPHVRLGLTSASYQALAYSVQIGLNRAKEYLFTGELMSAAEAERIGLVNRVLPDDELLPAAQALAARLASGAPLAIQATKQSLNRVLQDRKALLYDYGSALSAIATHSADHAEGVKAWAEGRKPVFTGR